GGCALSRGLGDSCAFGFRAFQRLGKHILAALLLAALVSTGVRTHGAAAAVATLTVHKDFTDANTSSVAIAVTCTAGAAPTVGTLNARDNPDTPAVFTINNIPTTGTICTASETVPAGYAQIGNTCTAVALS